MSALKWISILFMLSAFESSLLFSQEKRDSLITSGKASFYADHFHGRETSSGDYYNKNDFTAAHRTLPFNTVVSVTNKRNGKSVIVRINDRGPFVKSRIIDLSKSAAQKLEMVPYGVVPVRIHLLNVLDYLPLNDSLMKDGDAWDCYGNKKALNKQSIYIWSTDNVKHAFYMAAGISLDYDVDSVAVNVSGRDASRRYKLYALNVKEKDKLIYQLRKDGFRQARVQP